MSDGGGWQTALSSREQRNRERRKQKADIEKKNRQHQQEIKQQEKERVEQEKQAKRNKNAQFVIEFSPYGELPAPGQQAKGKNRRNRKTKKPVAKKPEKAEKKYAPINIEELKQTMAEINNKYPNDYPLQLEVISDKLEDAFSKIKGFDLNELLNVANDEEKLEKTLSKPINYLSLPVKASLTSWIIRVPNEALVDFFWTIFAKIHSPQTKRQLKAKGTGNLVILSLILEKISNFFTGDQFDFRSRFKKYLVLPKSSAAPFLKFLQSKNAFFTFPESDLPFFLWLFAQHRHSSPLSFFYCWGKYLFPAFCISTTSPAGRNLILSTAVITALSEIKPVQKPPGDIDTQVNSFEQIVLFHSLTNTPDLQKYFSEEDREDLAKVSSVYEEHFFSKAPSKFLPKLLFHIGRDSTYSDDSFFHLVLSALSLDDKSYSVWLSQYPNLVHATTSFFNRLTENLPSLTQKYSLNLPKLRQLAKEIIKKNETLQEKVNEKEEEVAALDASTKACKKFISESKPSIFPYLVLIFLLILAVIYAIYYFSCIGYGFQFPEACRTIEHYRIDLAKKLIK